MSDILKQDIIFRKARCMSPEGAVLTFIIGQIGLVGSSAVLGASLSFIQNNELWTAFGAILTFLFFGTVGGTLLAMGQYRFLLHGGLSPRSHEDGNSEDLNYNQFCCRNCGRASDKKCPHCDSGNLEY